MSAEIEVIVYDHDRANKEVRAYSIADARAAMAVTVAKFGPMHVVVGNPAEDIDSALCGTDWTTDMPATTLSLLQLLPGMFEDVPLCPRCLRAVPQR